MDMGYNMCNSMDNSNNSFLVRIKTKYNVINLQVEDYTTPEMQEIFDQPYVEEIYIENLNSKSKKLERIKKKWKIFLNIKPG